MLILSYT